MNVKPAIVVDSRETWAQRIRAAWRQSLEAIFDTGRLIASAKKELPHGSFISMIESDLPFKASTAQGLMKIANDGRLTSAAHVQHLPPHWGTLYELTKLSYDDLEAKIVNGTIHPHRRHRTNVRLIDVQYRGS